MEAARVIVIAALLTGCGRSPIQISHSGTGAYEASLTPLGHGFAATWYDTRDGNAEIYMRLLDASGRPTAPERRLTYDRPSSYEPDVIAIDDDIAVAWYEKGANGALTPKLGRWTRAGERRWQVSLAPSGRNTIVRRATNRLFVAWIVDGAERSDLQCAWVTLDGRTDDAQTIGQAGRTTWNLNAAVDGNGIPWVIYDARVGTRADELFLAAADSAGRPATMLTTDDGKASKYPDLGFNGTQAALTWFDERDGNTEVYLLVDGGEMLASPIDARAQRITRTPGESIGAYLAWAGSTLGVAWSDAVDGQHEVYFQPFDRSGRATANARRLTDSAPRSLVPSIRAWGKSFALAWNEYTPGAAADGHGDSRATSEIAFTLVQP
jgi:hypothetical protein